MVVLNKCKYLLREGEGRKEGGREKRERERQVGRQA